YTEVGGEDAWIASERRRQVTRRGIDRHQIVRAAKCGDSEKPSRGRRVLDRSEIVGPEVDGGTRKDRSGDRAHHVEARAVSVDHDEEISAARLIECAHAL